LFCFLYKFVGEEVMQVPAARVFSSSKIPSAIFPNSSVDVAGTGTMLPERSGYIDNCGYNLVLFIDDLRFVLFRPRAMLFLVREAGTAGVDSDHGFGLMCMAVSKELSDRSSCRLKCFVAEVCLSVAKGSMFSVFSSTSRSAAAAFNAAIKSAFSCKPNIHERREDTVPLTLRLALRQRDTICARFTERVGSLRNWMSASERTPVGVMLYLSLFLFVVGCVNNDVCSCRKERKTWTRSQT
jgi:hypothetical protein